ncbi:serine-rich adhesin for platelets-like isoform X1 [Clytia hemisphaerica]
MTSLNMTVDDELNFAEADSDSDSISVKYLLYPIIGSILTALVIIAVVAFILSNRKCQKRSPKDTESQILKEKLEQEKKRALNTSLVYSTMQGKPVYTSITQQEENEIAEEVRECYKTISNNVNLPIECCANGYSYIPKSQYPDKEPEIMLNKSGNPESHGESTFRSNTENQNIDLESDFDNDSLFSFHQNEDNLWQDHQNMDNVQNSNFQQHGEYKNEYDSNHSLSDCKDDENIPESISSRSEVYPECNSRKNTVTNSRISTWVKSDEDRVSEEFDNRDFSTKTNFDFAYEDDESVLTSVSRMDRRRIEKLRDTEFYRNLQQNDRKALNLSLDSIDFDNIDSTINTPIFGNTKRSVSHEEIVSVSSKDGDSAKDCQHLTDDESDYESTLLEWENISKRSLKKPLQYIDKDSESFFKIVRPELNPDEFSESGRTFSDDFKKSYREGSEFLESSLSTNTYSYDRESKYIVIERQNQEVNSVRLVSPAFKEKKQSVHNGGKHQTASSLATSHTSDFQSNLVSHSSKETLNEEDYEELAANLSYDDESLSLTLTDCQSQENSDYYPPFAGLPNLQTQERTSKYYTPSTKNYIGSGNLSLSDSNIQTQSKKNLDRNRLLPSNFITGSDRQLVRISTSQLISSSLNNNSLTSASTNNEAIFEPDNANETSNDNCKFVNSYKDQQSKTAKNQRTVPYHLRTPTKFRSARAGNLSAYISSRQSASKSGSTTPCNRTLNRSASPKMMATPKKTRQSPARRMFSSSARK